MWKTAAVGVIVLLGTGFCAGQETASQPTTRAVPSNHQRLNDLLALIEGPNAPQVRRTIARELLLQRWAETPPRLISLLNGPNGPAKVAVATALAELPEFLAPMYVDPLMAMLADADPDVCHAAAVALAAYPDHGVTARLRQWVRDTERPRQTRLAAIAALGLMTEREAIEGLVEALSDPDAMLAQAALAALGQATAMDFNGDVAAARAWWDENSALTREAWQQLQIERLVRKDRETRRRLEAVEARLANVLEAGFLRASDAERVSLLAGYLADSVTSIRLLGLRLTQLHLAEGKSLPAELQGRIRELLASAEPREQAAAVQTVASLREPQDAERFTEMLKTARRREVRLALLNGLGYVGTAAATEALLTVLDGADEQCAMEAVAAIGRLAERSVLAEGARDAVVTALSGAFEKTQPTQVALRERVLWAMANVADLRFGPAFVAALDPQEAVAVRYAAVRGIAALRSPQLGDALATAASDPDAGVRKTAIETLAVLGSSESDKQVQALWERVVSPQEPDESIRQAAWRGVLEILSKGSAEDVERSLAHLPGDGPRGGRRAAELLERLAKIAQESEPVDRGRLGRIRARLAVRYGQLEQPNEAIAAYLDALVDLHAADSDKAQPVSLEMLRFALVTGRYDETAAAALAGGNPGPDGLWQAVKAEVEPRLKRESVDEALAMLAAVEQHPPGAWPAEALEEIRQWRARAMQLKQPPIESAPASQPTSGPASQPVGITAKAPRTPSGITRWPA